MIDFSATVTAQHPQNWYRFRKPFQGREAIVVKVPVYGTPGCDVHAIAVSTDLNIDSAEAQQLLGRLDPPGQPIPIGAGPLGALSYEGDLRHIRLGDVELAPQRGGQVCVADAAHSAVPASTSASCGDIGVGAGVEPVPGDRDREEAEGDAAKHGVFGWVVGVGDELDLAAGKPGGGSNGAKCGARCAREGKMRTEG